MRFSLTCGVFDCLHEGHINLFEQMHTESDRIVVILHDDRSTFKNKGRFPVQSFNHRLRNLQLCNLVGEIFTCTKPDPSPIFSRAISMYAPVVYMRGDDWPDFPGKSVIESAEIPIKLVKYTRGVSTTQIRGELKKEIMNGTKSKYHNSGNQAKEHTGA